MKQDKEFIYNLLSNNYNLSTEEISHMIKLEEQLEVLKKIKAIKDKLINGKYYSLTDEDLSIITNDESLSEIVVNTFVPNNPRVYYDKAFLDCLNFVFAKKIAVFNEDSSNEEKEEKINKIKERMDLFLSKYEKYVIFDVAENDKSYIDILNLDDKNFDKITNIIDNVKDFDLKDFNGTVISLDQLTFPKKEKNKHKVRLFNEIVDAHKKSINSYNMEENKTLYNNLLLFLELGIDKSILNNINGNKKIILELKDKGYINDEDEYIDAPHLIDIIKKDIDNTKGDTKYNFLHKVTDLYIEKERTNYVNNDYFEEITYWNPVDESINKNLKNNDYQKVIGDLVNANSYVETDEEEVDEIVNTGENSIEIIRKLNALFKDNCEKYRIIKDSLCKREVKYNLPYDFNKTSLKNVLQNDILVNLTEYDIVKDEELISLRDYLVDEIVKQDNEFSNYDGDKNEVVNNLLTLYIERLKGLDNNEKKDYDKCIEEINSLTSSKDVILLMDGKEYDENTHKLSNEVALTIKNAKKKKKNYLENAEKEIRNTLINDLIKNNKRCEVNDLRLDEYLVKNISNHLKDEANEEILQRKILNNLEIYGEDDKKLDSLDKKINKIIKEEVSKIYDKNSLYILKNNNGEIIREKYDKEKHKDALGLNTYLENLNKRKEDELKKDIKDTMILDIFNNMSKYQVKVNDQELTLYDYLIEKVKKDQTTEEFQEELDKIIRSKKDFDNKKMIKTINELFKDLLPLEKNDHPKYALFYNNEPYNLEEHKSNIDELLLERTKEYSLKDTYVDNQILYLLSDINIEELKKNLLEDDEAYKSFMRLLGAKKFLSIPNVVESRLEDNNYRLTSETLTSFITHYKDIIEREKKEAINRGTVFTESSLSIPKIVDLGNAEITLNSKYSTLFGMEDTLYLFKDPNENSSGTEEPEERLAKGIYYLLNNYQKQYVTVPTFDEDIIIEDGYDKKINVVCGNFSDTLNLTHGERTGACMRINGAGKSLFSFCLTDENGFHITMEDPETNEYISRASCFRNGNTVIINGLRDSFNVKYSNDEIINVLYKVANELIEKTKNDEYPIENVFVGKQEAFCNNSKLYDEEFYDVPNIQEGLPNFYLDAVNGGILLATTNKDLERKYVPITVGVEKLPKYEVQRGKIREYVNNEEVAKQYRIINTSSFDKAKEKILMIEEAKNLMGIEGVPNSFEYEKDISNDTVDDIKEAIEQLEIKPIDYEIKYALVSDDYYIALDKDYNIHSSYLDIPSNKAKIERNAMIDRVKNICASLIEKEANIGKKMN